MAITLQQIITLLPMSIVVLTIIILMFFITWHRNYFISSILTIFGLKLALLSLWLVIQTGSTDIMSFIRVDGFSIFYIALVLIASLKISVLSCAWLTEYQGNRDEFYLLLLIATLGSILLVSANHLAIMFLGIELISLPLFGMIGYKFCENNSSLEASIKYTILSATAASFLIFGIALVYTQTGQLSFSAFSKTFSNTILVRSVILAGLGMMMVSLCFKLSLVPFHLWTPDIYQGSSAPVSAFLSTISKISVFVVFIRLFLNLSEISIDNIQSLLSIIASTSMLFGNLMALNQKNIKRILGYSSIAHLGYLLIGLIVLYGHRYGYDLALETVGVYLVGYVLSNLGAFGVVSLVSNIYNIKTDIDSLNNYKGLFWHQPLLSLILTAMMLSLAGIPMTIGFIGKFYIITLSINNNLYWMAISVVISSVIGLFYYLRIIINLFLSPAKGIRINNTSCKSTLNISVLVLITTSLLVIALGLYPQPIINLVQLARPII